MDASTDASKLAGIFSCLISGLVHYSYFKDCTNKSYIFKAQFYHMGKRLLLHVFFSSSHMKTYTLKHMATRTTA